MRFTVYHVNIWGDTALAAVSGRLPKGMSATFVGPNFRKRRRAMRGIGISTALMPEDGMTIVHATDLDQVVEMAVDNGQLSDVFTTYLDRGSLVVITDDESLFYFDGDSPVTQSIMTILTMSQIVNSASLLKQAICPQQLSNKWWSSVKDVATTFVIGARVSIWNYGRRVRNSLWHASECSSCRARLMMALNGNVVGMLWVNTVLEDARANPPMLVKKNQPRFQASPAPSPVVEEKSEPTQPAQAPEPQPPSTFDSRIREAFADRVSHPNFWPLVDFYREQLARVSITSTREEILFEVVKIHLHVQACKDRLCYKEDKRFLFILNEVVEEWFKVRGIELPSLPKGMKTRMLRIPLGPDVTMESLVMAARAFEGDPQVQSVVSFLEAVLGWEFEDGHEVAIRFVGTPHAPWSGWI